MGENADLSVLKPPVLLGKSGITQIMHSLKDGTEEVRNMLMNECKVILECKVCSSLFRGLPNFLAHKRRYCQESSCNLPARKTSVGFDSAFVESAEADEEKMRPKSPVVCADISTKPDTRQLLKKEARVQLLRIDENRNAMIQKVAQKPVSEKSSGDVQKSNPSKKAEKLNTQLKVAFKKHAKKVLNIELPSRQKINSKHAHELYRKVFSHYHFCDLKQLVCRKCDISYQSFKSLKRHMIDKHIIERKRYPCPQCGSLFQKWYNVRRHMLQVHKMSWRDIERLNHKESIDSYNINPLELAASTSDVQVNRQDKMAAKVKLEKVDDDGREDLTAVLSKDNSVEKENSHGSKGSNQCSMANQMAAAKDSESKKLMLFKCVQCNKAFGKKATYDHHIQSCSGDSSGTHLQEKNSGLNSSDDVSSQSCMDTETVKVLNDTDQCLDKETPQQNGKEEEKKTDSSETGSMEKFKQHLYNMRFSSHQSLSAKQMSELRQIIDESKHKCLRCCMKFRNNSALHQHAIRHMGWKRFRCKLCGYKEFNRSNIKTHLRRLHPAKIAGQEDLNCFVVNLYSQNENINCVNADLSHASEVIRSRESSKSHTKDKTSGSKKSSAQSDPRINPNSKVIGSGYNISTRRSQRTFDLRPCRGNSLLSSRKVKANQDRKRSGQFGHGDSSKIVKIN